MKSLSYIHSMIVVIGLCVSTNADADDEISVTREAVAALIQRLDARTLADRSRAERELLDLGPAALRFLPSSEVIESIPVRESVRRIRIQLERRAAKEASGPARMTLQGNYPVKEILRQIQIQTSNRVAIDSNTTDMGQKTVAVDWQRSTFWECLDEVCEQAKLTWKFDQDLGSIRVSDKSEPRPKIHAVQRSGIFRIEIHRLEIRSVVGEVGRQMLRVEGRIAIEPRLRALFLVLAAAETHAMINDDLPLKPWTADAKYDHPIPEGGHEVPVTFDYALPATTDVKTVAIRGKIHCQIASSTERVVFDRTSMERGTVRRRGGVSVRLRNASFPPTDGEKTEAEIGIAVSYDAGGPAFESHRTWVLHNDAYLETKTGERFSFNDFDTTQQSDGAVAVDYRWKNLALPVEQYQFVYEAPTLIVDVPLEFDIDRLEITE